MIKKLGICAKCNRETVIVNKKYMLCFVHNNQRLFIEKKAKQKAEGKMSLIDFYKSLEAKRGLVCFFTKKRMYYKQGSSLWRSCFMHVLAKGIYPKLAFLEDNVLIVDPSIHHEYDHGTEDKLKALIGQQGIDYINEMKKKKLL